MASAINIRCKRGAADKEAEPISDGLITSESMAVKRGKRFIDDNYYIKKTISLKVPHKSADILPGTFITLTSEKMGYVNQLVLIKSYNIEITPNSVWASIEGVTFDEPV